MGLLEAEKTWLQCDIPASLPPRPTITMTTSPTEASQTAHSERHWLHVTVFCLLSSTPPIHITTSQWSRTTLLLCEAFLPDLLNLISFPPPPYAKRCHRAGKLRQALALYWKRSLIIPVAINRIYFKREILLNLNREVIYA